MSSDQTSGTHSCPNCSAFYKIPPLHETLTPCLLKGKLVCWRLSHPATLCGQRQLVLSRSGTSTHSFFHLILLFCFTDAIWRSHSVLSWPCFGGWASDLYIVRAACKPFGDPSLWKAFYDTNQGFPSCGVHITNHFKVICAKRWLPLLLLATTYGHGVQYPLYTSWENPWEEQNLHIQNSF